MVISSKGRYALRVMVDLAEHGGDGYVSMRDVAGVFVGDLLPGGDLLQGDIFLRPMLGQIYHHTQRIAPLGGNDHRHSFLFFPVLVLQRRRAGCGICSE